MQDHVCVVSGFISLWGAGQICSFPGSVYTETLKKGMSLITGK